jgi:hypothetical protein
MKSYFVKFTYNGSGELEPQIRRYRVASIIRAYEKCREDYPGAEIIEGWSEGGLGINYGSISYPPVSNAKVEPLPSQKAEEERLAFYDDCLGTRDEIERRRA